jgi:hypothetical protein
MCECWALKNSPKNSGSPLLDGSVLHRRIVKYSETVELVNYYPTILLGIIVVNSV